MTIAQQFGLEVDADLLRFVNEEAMPGTGIAPASFWAGFAALLSELAPVNAALLAERDALQARIDAWHGKFPGIAGCGADYRAMLADIGYRVATGPDFEVTTDNVDAEIATLAGPQLVVPVSNARYALNAANARWGSLYDALYGTDVVPEADGAQRAGSYNPVRGERVVAYGRDFLDRYFPLDSGSHREATGYRISDGRIEVTTPGGRRRLRSEAAFAGFRGPGAAPELLLLRHHGLHAEIHIDRAHLVGRGDAAGVSDLVLESAVTTIQDLEDSVAAVDAQDKIIAYRNWLGLMRGTLEARFPKGGSELLRRLNADRAYTGADGREFTLARAQPAAGAQCRTPHDDRHGADRWRPQCPKPCSMPRSPRSLRCTTCGPRERCATAAAARCTSSSPSSMVRRKWRSRCAVRARRGAARAAAQHAQDRHHGRGAAHLRKSPGMHSRGARARRVHQYRLSRPHRR